MVDIKISGRKVTVTDAMRSYAVEKIGDALKVFDITPMSCDVVLRVDKNPSNPDSQVAEVTVFVRESVVRVVSAEPDMYAAIDSAADKVTRQLRKYKTRIVDRRQRAGARAPEQAPAEIDFDAILGEQDDELVREKVIDMPPMTEEEALVQTDLIGHDFYVFTNATRGVAGS